MTSSSGSTLSPAAAEPGINMRKFSNDPLLLRLDMATYAFYKNLEDETDKKLMEIVARAANVNVNTRYARKKELKNYKQPGHDENTRNVRIKYRTCEENLLQSGTFDPVWGLKWLLSFVVLVDTPVLNSVDVSRLCELTEQWLDALVQKDIHEIADYILQLKELLQVARVELVCLRTLCEKLPGQFNNACSLLFGGDLKRVYVDSYLPKWAAELRARDTLDNQGQPVGKADEESDSLVGGISHMSMADAQECVAGIVPLGTKSHNRGSFDLRVQSIGSTADVDSGLVPIQVCIFDRQQMKEQGEELTLLLEQSTAVDIRVGFTIEATLYRLDNGRHFIDSVTMVWPSYAPLDYSDIF